MTLTQLILSFIVIWSLCVFFLLPVGVKQEDNPGPLEAKGAPKDSHFRRKIAGASLMAIVFTFLLRWVLKSGLIHT